MDIFFNQSDCRFETSSKVSDFQNTELPLSVIFQVTRKCNFSCVFCSEIEQFPDPTLKEIEKIKENLTGVKRVYLSGGEPLLRRDFKEILDIFNGETIIGLPTNATIHNDSIMRVLSEKINFANIGLDGPRSVTSRIRGDYDKIIDGIFQFKKYNIPISLSCVVLTSTLDSVLFTCQIADSFKANKLKLILPIPKGNALNLPDSEYLSSDQASLLVERVSHTKELYKWKPKITLTTWSPDVEGYSILIFPDANVFAWPVYDTEDKLMHLGNLLEENIRDIWKKYPYKENHFRKYLGESIDVI